MKEIAVVGPGLMGLGIAQVAAAAGWQVWLVGRDAAAAAAGHARLASHLERQVARGRLDRTGAYALLAQVGAVADDTELAGCELAIECVPEDRALKLGVLSRLQDALPAGTLIATNTSGLPVTLTASSPCRLAGNFLYVIPGAPGTSCVVTATQPGDAVYAAAPPVQYTFTILANLFGMYGVAVLPAVLARLIEFPTL